MAKKKDSSSSASNGPPDIHPEADNVAGTDALFGMVFKFSPDAASITRLSDGLIVNVNERFSAISGYPLDEVIGKTTVELNFFGNDTGRRSIVTELGSRGFYENLEVLFRRKDGSTITGIISGRIITYQGVPHVYSIMRDISDRKRAEEEVKRARRDWENIFNAIGQVALVLDSEHTILTANHAAARSAGCSPNELVGRKCHEIFHGSDTAPYGCPLAKMSDSGHMEVTEMEMETLKGTFLVSCTPVLDDAGRLEKIIHLATDITDRIRSEAARNAEKELLAVTLRSIGDGVITTDTRGAVVMMNKVAEDLCGWQLEEARGKPLPSVFSIIHEISRTPTENPVEKVLESGRIIELANHTLLVSRDGTERIIADSGAPIKDKKNTIIGVVLVFRDMTEKQKLLETSQKNQKLESLGVLAGGIAHDFNNLLVGIFGNIDLARLVSKEAEVVEHLDATLAIMNRARGLTQQLLTFAKGGAPVLKIGSLTPFLEETVRFALSGSNVSCRLDVEPDIWPCNLDKNQIGQVIDNIIINAEQAMPMGGTIEITARNTSLRAREHAALAQGRYVIVSIKDSGIGIPKDILPRIFDPFFTTKTKGHGLGLAMCHSIMSRHGGAIDVRSEQGRGSTFDLYLPASAQAGSPPAEESAVPQPGSGTIVVMDDDEYIRNTVAAILATQGYTVILKNNGQEVLDFLSEARHAGRAIAGILLDLTIPGGMGGKEALPRVREIAPEIPVFVASGYSDDPVMADPVGHGFDASICKPFRIAELLEMLARHLKKQ